MWVDSFSLKSAHSVYVGTLKIKCIYLEGPEFLKYTSTCRNILDSTNVWPSVDPFIFNNLIFAPLAISFLLIPVLHVLIYCIYFPLIFMVHNSQSVLA